MQQSIEEAARKNFEKLYKLFKENDEIYNVTDKIRWGKSLKDLVSFTITPFHDKPNIVLEIKADTCWTLDTKKK